jgi:hypothetical protein
MTIHNALSRGRSEEQWRSEQERSLKSLSEQSPDKAIPHSDAANRYEQLVDCLKDLSLWPW